MKQNKIWISGANIVTQNSAREVRTADLVIENGIIVDLAKPRRKTPRGFRNIKADGLTILPGFVQTHVHLCQTLFRNLADDLELLDWLRKKIWVFEARHSKETVRLSAQIGIQELLSSGTTCILDMGTVRHTEEIFKVASAMGIRANIGKCLMDHQKNNPTDLCENTEIALAEALALFKKWNGKEQDRLRASFAPRFAISCTEELLRQVAQLSAKHQAIIHTHASENRTECDLVQQMSGMNNVQYLDSLGLCTERSVIAHGVWLAPEEMRLLAERASSITHCPSSNLKLASGVAPIPELIEHGVNVALGADGAPCNNTLNIFQEMRLAATLHKPRRGPTTLTAVEVLDLATRNGAQALHWFDQIGSIEVSKKADLVALNLNTPVNLPADNNELAAIASSIVYTASPSNVVWTMVEGRTVFDCKNKDLLQNKLLARLVKAKKHFA